MKSLKWIQGPELPLGIKDAASVALPPSSNFFCVLIGGGPRDSSSYSCTNVYGLNRSSNEWTVLGEIRTGRVMPIALPLS